MNMSKKAVDRREEGKKNQEKMIPRMIRKSYRRERRRKGEAGGKRYPAKKTKKMTDEAKIYIVCDKLAGETIQVALKGDIARGGALLDLPNVGLIAMLK